MEFRHFLLIKILRSADIQFAFHHLWLFCSCFGWLLWHWRLTFCNSRKAVLVCNIFFVKNTIFSGFYNTRQVQIWLRPIGKIRESWRWTNMRRSGRMPARAHGCPLLMSRRLWERKPRKTGKPQVESTSYIHTTLLRVLEMGGISTQFGMLVTLYHSPKKVKRQRPSYKKLMFPPTLVDDYFWLSEINRL